MTDEQFLQQQQMAQKGMLVIKQIEKGDEIFKNEYVSDFQKIFNKNAAPWILEAIKFNIYRQPDPFMDYISLYVANMTNCVESYFHFRVSHYRDKDMVIKAFDPYHNQPPPQNEGEQKFIDSGLFAKFKSGMDPIYDFIDRMIEENIFGLVPDKILFATSYMYEILFNKCMGGFLEQYQIKFKTEEQLKEDGSDQNNVALELIRNHLDIERKNRKALKKRMDEFPGQGTPENKEQLKLLDFRIKSLKAEKKKLE